MKKTKRHTIFLVAEDSERVANFLKHLCGVDSFSEAIRCLIDAELDKHRKLPLQQVERGKGGGRPKKVETKDVS